MHIRHNNVASAVEIMRHAVSNKKSKQNLVNNIRSWSLYIDLLHSCDELDDAANAYDHVVERKIATPLMILNYASMLQQRNKFEESFKVFERATKMFPWPNCYEIWLTYISTFI